MNTQMRLIRVLLLAMLYPYLSNGQDTSKYDIIRIDTFRLTEKTFPKTVAYNFRSIIIYVDYFSFSKIVEGHLKGNESYNRSTFKLIQKKLRADIKTSDTVFLTQATFDSVNMIPFDDFIIDQIENNKCAIKDSLGKSNSIIIRKKVASKKRLWGWGGRLYYIENAKQHFLEGTDWVS